MFYHGSFLDIEGREVEVRIKTPGGGQTVIGSQESGLWFSGESPVELTGRASDTRDVILPTECTIRLSTRGFESGLFTGRGTDGVVNVLRGGEVVFAGFLQPLAYTQSFASAEDDLELTAVDLPAALAQMSFGGVGQKGIVSHAEQRAAGGYSTLRELVLEAVDALGARLLIGPAGAPTGQAVKVWVEVADGERMLWNPAPLLRRWSVSRLLMLGETVEDVWTYRDVIEEALRPVGLHMAQEGGELFLFSWPQVRDVYAPGVSVPRSWRDLRRPDDEPVERPGRLIEITAYQSGDTDATVTVGEAFSRVTVVAERQEADAVVSSPMEEADLVSPFSRRQHYLREYSVANKHVDQGYRQIQRMVYRGLNVDFGNDTTPEGTDAEVGTKIISDWYVRVMNHPRWELKRSLFDADQAAAVEAEATGTRQQDPLTAAASGLCATIAQVGSVDYELPIKDDSPGSLEMGTVMFFGVHGNESDDPATTYPSREALMEAAPMASYASELPGEVLRPSPGCTNYIVFSGEIALAPLSPDSQPWKELDRPTVITETVPGRHLVSYGKKAGYPADENNPQDNRRYYTRKFLGAERPTLTPEPLAAGVKGLTPVGERTPHHYEYRGGTGTLPGVEDVVKKLPALSCMLVVGDKVLVETGATGTPADFTWKPYKERGQCADDAEYYAQCFTLGFNPTPGDLIVGEFYPIANNVGFELGIDAEGLAIPIPEGVRLSGRVRFDILGPAVMLWRHKGQTITLKLWEILKLGGIWKWTAEQIPLLAHIDHIELRDFEVKVYSDNGGLDFGSDTGDDIAYSSDTSETSDNPMEEETWRIHSALTAAEAAALGVADVPCLSNLTDAYSGDPVTGWNGVKPEQRHVDELYNEYHNPPLMLEQTVRDTPYTSTTPTVDRWSLYTLAALAPRRFHVLGINRDLRMATARLSLIASST